MNRWLDAVRKFADTLPLAERVSIALALTGDLVLYGRGDKLPEKWRLGIYQARDCLREALMALEEGRAEE